MSLLNEVLRDLQARGATEADPLAGLAPVSASSPSLRRFAPLVGVGAAITVALLWMLLRPEAEFVAAGPAAVTAAAAAAPGEPITPIEVAVQPKPMSPAAVKPATVTPVEAITPVVVAVQPKPLMPVVAETSEAAGPAPIISRRDAADPGVAATASIRRGLQALRAGKALDAARLFEDALRTDRGNSEAWQYLFAARSAAGLRDAAEKALRHGLGASRDTAPLAKLYARLLLERGETAAAIGVLQRHRPTATSDNEYDTLLAGLLLGNQQFAAAGEIYRQLIDRDERPGAWWIGLAMSSDSLGDRAAALAAFERALRADGLEPPLASYAERRIAELKSNG